MTHIFFELGWVELYKSLILLPEKRQVRINKIFIKLFSLTLELLLEKQIKENLVTSQEMTCQKACNYVT